MEENYDYIESEYTFFQKKKKKTAGKMKQIFSIFFFFQSNSRIFFFFELLMYLPRLEVINKTINIAQVKKHTYEIVRHDVHIQK